MRVKYRIWDNEDNKYFEPIYEAYKGRVLDISLSPSGELLRRTLEHPSEHESRFPERYEIEMFTGLSDKNGKEIYEGDIVFHNLKSNINGIISYFEGSFIVGKSLTSNSIINFNAPKYLQIIGNIHENPELLK